MRVTTQCLVLHISALIATAILGGCSGEQNNSTLVSGGKLLPAETRDAYADLRPGLSCPETSTSTASMTWCTWSDSGGLAAECTLMFDSEDYLAHLFCVLLGTRYDCVRPGDVVTGTAIDLFACYWEHLPECADVYTLAGSFRGFYCGVALDARLGGAEPLVWFESCNDVSLCDTSTSAISDVRPCVTSTTGPLLESEGYSCVTSGERCQVLTSTPSSGCDRIFTCGTPPPVTDCTTEPANRCDGVVCSAPDSCSTAACNPATGTCEYAPVTDGTPCDDSNACTQSDTCQAGTCTGAEPVVCDAPGMCQEAGVCDPVSGACVYENRPLGTPCDDGNACTQNDICSSGVCGGVATADGTSCDDMEACTSNDVCTNGLCAGSAVADGTRCDDGDECTLGDTCEQGACTGHDTFSVGLDGSQVAPWVGYSLPPPYPYFGDPDGYGRIRLELILGTNGRTNSVRQTGSWTGIDAPQRAHVHYGQPGVSNVDMFNTPTWSPAVQYDTTNNAQRFTNTNFWLVRNWWREYYLNLHTQPFPNGAIRGQLSVEPFCSEAPVICVVTGRCVEEPRAVPPPP